MKLQFLKIEELCHFFQKLLISRNVIQQLNVFYFGICVYMISLTKRNSAKMFITATSYITVIITCTELFSHSFRTRGQENRRGKEMEKGKPSGREGRKITHLHPLPTWTTGDSGRAVPLPLQAGKDIL